MNWKALFKLDMFKSIFLIVFFVIYGIPFDYQLQLPPADTAFVLYNLDETNREAYLKDIGWVIDYDKSGNIELYEPTRRGLRTFWAWDGSSITAHYTTPNKIRFISFNFEFFILTFIVIYFLAGLIFVFFGNVDKTSKTSGRKYSRSGLGLLSLSTILLSSRIMTYLNLNHPFFLAFLITIILGIVAGLLGYNAFKQQDKVSGCIVLVLGILTILISLYFWSLDAIISAFL